MRYNRRRQRDARPFFFLLVVTLFFLLASALTGQEPAKADKPPPVDADGMLTPGEGFPGLVPTWFCLLKVESRHFTDRGSACFIEDRIVLTCWHNLRDVRKGKLVLVDGFGNRYEDIQILQTSPKLDLALLRINDEKMPYHRSLVVSNSDFKTEGTVHAVGLDPSVEAIVRNQGKLTGKVFGQNGLDDVCYEHDAKVVGGMSGGPLVNNYGEVVGVNTHSDGKTSHSVRLDRLQWFLDQYNGSLSEG